MDQDSDPIGDLADLEQRDELDTLPIPTVPVRIDGPVPVQVLPTISSGSRNYTVALAAVRIGNADTRRASFTIVSLDENFYYGTDQATVERAYGALWPALVPLVLTHRDQVYVAAFQNTTVISVVSENWAS